ncbi:MAG TPA: acyl-CoA synthetase [Steroidobacteraceae bacterium]|nr:acyl-CoA synthetase [Steroidobacteraceae bacterium]
MASERKSAMHPRELAVSAPNRPAIVMAPSGASVTFGELTDRSDRAAQLFDQLGLRPGDNIALCLENHPRYFEICWAAHNAGLYYTPISTRLKPSEVAYIVRDCNARVLVMSQALAQLATELPGDLVRAVHCFMVDGATDRFRSYEAAVAECPATPLANEVQGVAMVYSSGTTGSPKGIKPPMSSVRVDQPGPLQQKLIELYGFDRNTVYLSTAPLYHTAPLKFNMTVLAAGGATVILERFEPELALQTIERYRVTHSQWVPTMFIRMLRLPGDVRSRYRLDTHRLAIHAAAPCPVDVKEQMLDWWGPIIHEYYSGSESIGMCAIAPQEWLRHKGSVGKAARGELHILSEDGTELPPHQDGLVFFANGGSLQYHNDPQKTARAHNGRGWATIGDIGHVDEEGYLYLTDRRDYVINSGGVNIYPQEAENVLSLHPHVLDVAVFGIPNAEFGEEVKAVVIPSSMNEAGPELERELIEYCRQRLSTIKCPKSVDFAAELPREPTGKLLKKRIRERYWVGHSPR